MTELKLPPPAPPPTREQLQEASAALNWLVDYHRKAPVAWHALMAARHLVSEALILTFANDRNPD